MDLTLTEDQELVRDAARELLESRRATAGVRAVAADPAGHSTGLWKEMTELGWTGLALPEAYGGVGAGFLEACLVFEELGRSQVPSPLAATVACCGLPIARYGTDEQRAEWLPAIVRGRIMTAAPARWDRAAPGVGDGDADGAGGGGGVIATRDGPDGAGFVLAGTAEFVPYAHVADALLVVADLAESGESGEVGEVSGAEVSGGGEAGDGAASAAFLVDAEAPGLGTEPLDALGADRPHRVRFDGVRVPAGRVLPGGAAAAAAISAYGAAATCAELVGAAQRVLDMTVEYAGEREQFGRPIGAFQAVQHLCADMATDVLTSRFIAYEAIWRLSAGLEATLEVSMAKAWVSEAAERVCARGHQVHGAIGFTHEHDLHLYTRHVMAAALRFGDGDHHVERVARLLDLPG